MNRCIWPQLFLYGRRKSFMGDGRVYLRWKGSRDVVGDFKRSIEEQVFPGDNVVVMHAPNRRSGAAIGKKNTLEGTIEYDKGFKEFCDALEAAEGKPVYSHPIVSGDKEEVQGNVGPEKVTPLMEFLAKKHRDKVRNQNNKGRLGGGNTKGKLPQQKVMKENSSAEGTKENQLEEGKNKGGNQKRRKKNQKKKQVGEEKKQGSSGGKPPVKHTETSNKKPATGDASSAPKILSRSGQGVSAASNPNPPSANAVQDSQKKNQKKKKRPSSHRGKKPQSHAQQQQ